MDPNIFIGIAVLFLQTVLTVGGLLIVLKILHHVFEWEDAYERKYNPRYYFNHD